MATTDQAKGLDPAFLEDFAQRWADAWNSHDGNAVAALCTEDIVYDDPALEQTARSRAEVAAFVEQAVRAFPDFRFEEPEPPYPSRTEQKAIVPWRMIATHAGPMEPPGFAPTGAKVVIDGVDHWWFRDGLVAKYRADYDLMAVARALGAVPEAGSRAEKVGAFMQRIKARGMRRRAS
jgi:steroid delta-isomerase-like uncharacterized protein